MWSTSNRCGDRSSSRSRDNWTFAGSRSGTSTGAGFRAGSCHPIRTRRSNVRGELCADPRAEVVEALRWARELLSRGNVSALDIAITAASPSAFDEHMLVLASQAGIPIHFSHGIPALSSWEGQSCAALADVLGNGLSQERVRRLMRHCIGGTTISFPDDWATGLPPQAGLFTVDQWRRALHSARDRRSDAGCRRAIADAVARIAGARTFGAPKRPARPFSCGASLGLWKDALRNAPAAAVAMSLEIPADPRRPRSG